ncbi:MAG: aconitate hydratase AcnA [Planctomycetia bacterium]|nr:aconitate hydratase AcnA [Planctomycetia bacterium]
MAPRLIDPFAARSTLSTRMGKLGFYRLARLEELGLAKLASLPFSMRILLEAALRKCDGYIVTEADVKNLAAWNAAPPTPALPPTPTLPRGGGREAPAAVEIPFLPARVVLQDFTGVPCVVDLAAMRSAMQRLGGDPAKINPLIPVDLVIDHSVQVDFFGTPDAIERNVAMEYQRNLERYRFLRWGQKAFDNFRVVPPSVGIVHQVNLEYLAQVVFVGDDHAGKVAFPDTLVGTDSHTTMINGLGVLGWGVGGIEAEAVMLGQPLYMLLPEVVGFKLTGRLPPGATATDLVLTCTQILRAEGVVNKFVEFFGPGVSSMGLADRATIANMAPEYGATMGYFPVDGETLDYLRRTGRSDEQVDLVERYVKEQGLFRTDDSAPTYTKFLTLDLATIQPCLAGPKRPHDRVNLVDMKDSFRKALEAPVAQRGFGLDAAARHRKASVPTNGKSAEITHEITHGAVVIAAITSCTNTSNPSVMIGAGLLARNAIAKGLKVKPFVKTSLAPGSRVVTDYLEQSGLARDLDQLGFATVGYGCTTCIGNSGPLPENVAKAVTGSDLVVSAVLSGNRNFEGRINPLVKANYLASPPLVVAYALAGTTDIDMVHEPLGQGKDGPVFLKDIWPGSDEVAAAVKKMVRPEMFRKRYESVFTSNEEWNKVPVEGGKLYPWDESSTYIQEPPFLVDLSPEPGPIEPIRSARVLCALGDSVTTDHISPAGSIAKTSPAGKFLIERGVNPKDFNSYGARRGNDRVMTRGTFANIRIRNHLAPGTEGGVTRLLPEGNVMPIYDAAMEYKKRRVPLVVLAGAEYGSGSSRDWAAKGTHLLGVRAVMATSFERIHRSNLVGMGVLPLEFPAGQTWQSLGLTGEETYDIPVNDKLAPQSTIAVTATAKEGTKKTFQAKVRIDTPVEMDYFRQGGILQTVLRKLLKV